MMKRETWMTIGLMALACGGNGEASAAAAEYRLEEHLGHEWRDELIAFTVEFQPGECDRVARVTANGEPVHFQAPRQSVEQHPDGSLASARIYVLTDLAPGQSILFRALGDGEANATDLPATDLRVDEGDGVVSLTTGSGGVRLPLGEFSDDIPAPYQGFKLHSGRWVGGSRLMGRASPETLHAELIESGPLFAEVKLTYTYPEGRRHTLRCRVIAGQAVALFEETFDTEPGSRYHRNLNYNYSRFVQGRFGYGDPFEESHWVRLHLDGFTPDLSKTGASPDLGSHSAYDVADPWLATLHPWQSWHGGSHAVPLAGEEDYIGLLTLSAGSWVRALENLILVKQEDGEVFLQLPANDGARRWGVHFGPADAWKPTGPERPARQYPGLDNPSPLRRALVKYGELTLDRVKDWELAWEDTQDVPYPVSINLPGRLDEVRERIANDPVLSAHAEKVTANWERLRGHDDFPFTINWVTTPEGVEDVYLTGGEERHGRELYELTRARLRYYAHQTLGGLGFHNYRAGHGYGMFNLAHTLVGLSRQADVCLGSPHVDREEKTELRALLAFFTYLFDDPDYWPANDIGKGTYNMYASRDAMLGLMGAVLAGHPAASRWQKAGEDRMEDILSNFIKESGAMIEGMHYSGVTVDFVLPFVTLLNLSGGRNYFVDRRFQKGMEWYASHLPPVDPRFGRAYMPPFGYSHNSNTSQSVRWAVAAAMTSEDAPDFSGLMMRTWRNQGSVLKMVGGEAGYRSAFFVGVVDPSLPVPEDPGLTSASWDGSGAVLRNHSDSSLETFMAVPTGTGFRIYPSEGTFQLHAKGAPLCLRFGTRSFNPIATMQAWMNNRITFDKMDECTNDRGKIITWASLASGDLFGGEYRFTRLAARQAMQGDESGNMELSEPRIVDTDLPVGEGLGFFGDHRDVPPQQWRRFIMFVKDEDPLGPNYFLVRDNFLASLPTDWNIWCLADDMEMEGSHATFKGKFGVDLDVYKILGGGHKVTGAWGPDWERQRLLQFQKDVNESYFAVLYPRTEDEPKPRFRTIADGAGVRMSLPDRADFVFLSEDPVRVDEEGVTFSGRAGFAVQEDERLRLTLLSGDSIAAAGFTLMHGRQVVEDVRESTEGPISLSATIEPGPRIRGEYSGGARTVTIHVPVAYRHLSNLTIDGEPAELQPTEVGVFSFGLQAGKGTFEILP